jgi:ribosomal protein L9
VPEIHAGRFGTDQRRQFVIHFLMKKGVATKNATLALAAIDREQNEIAGKRKDKQIANEVEKTKLAERRVVTLETKMANAQKLIEGAKNQGGITPETLEKIERELKLF